MTDFNRDERTPLESYTFTYTEQEMKSLRNELDKSTFVKLIVLLAIVLVLMIYSIIVNLESQFSGFSLATFLYIGSVLLIRVKQRKYLAERSDKRVAQNVYLYDFFDDCLRVTVHRNGVFVSCSYVEYSDIELYWNAKEYYAFTAGSLLYMVRKSALCENSCVPQLVCRSNMHRKPETLDTQNEEKKIPDELKPLDRLTLAFFIASLVTPFVVVILLAFLTVNFGVDSTLVGAGFLLCMLVALGSLISGMILRAKGVKRVRNIISGIIIAIIFFGFTYMCFFLV